MRAAIERRDGSGGTFMPEQCLTFEETILLFTKGVAEGARAEKIVGSLLPGQYADFNVWNNNFKSKSVKDFSVPKSYVNGDTVHIC